MNNNYKYQKNLEEAKICFNQYISTDPFPGIRPALLNRDDIEKYVEKTGMIFPFRAEKLKSASYEVKLGEEVLYWDQKNKKIHRQDLRVGKDYIRLRKNSITYVGLEATFLLPYYIAVRFNLSITHVHRGLLLGTGPLIDPGFIGKIMVPIHNLTPNDYIIYPGEDLIAVEFTKVSDNALWDSTAINDIDKRSQELKFRKNIKKPNPTFEDFIQWALPSEVDSVRSSLEAALNDAEEKIEQARKSTIKWSWGVGLTALFGIIGLLYACFTLLQETSGVVSDANKYVADATNAYQSAFSMTVDDKVYNDIKSKTEMDIDKKLRSFQSEIKSQADNDYEEIDKRLMHLAHRISGQIRHSKANDNKLEKEIHLLNEQLNNIKDASYYRRLKLLHDMLVAQEARIEELESKYE